MGGIERERRGGGVIWGSGRGGEGEKVGGIERERRR